MSVRTAVATFRGHHVPHIEFIRRKAWWFGISGALIVLSLVGLFARGLNFSIDFKGGALLQMPNRSGASAGDYQRVLNRFGLGEAKVEIFQGGQCPPGGCVSIQSKSLEQLGLVAAPTPSSIPSATSTASPSPSASATPSPSATPSAAPTPSATATAASPSPPPAARATTPKADQLRNLIARTAGINTSEINETDVGPTWGGTISRKAVVALVAFVILVSIYISLRFEPKMAAAALVALAHDLIITAGIYALVGREVTPETVIAILTILGYSLYDTVVIFDKIKENTETVSLVARETYSGVVNMSLNQTFMRSVNTSLVVLLPIGALLLFGGQTLKDFAFALFVGVASGTYSSIFVASPVLALLKENEPRYQQIRARATARSGRPGLRTASAVAGELPGARLEMDGDGDGASGRVPERRSATTTRPRPSGSSARKKKKGKPQGKPKPRRR